MRTPASIIPLLFLFGCTTSQTKNEAGDELSESQIEKTDVVVSPEAAADDSSLQKEMPFEKGIYLEEYVDKREVQKWLDNFQGDGREHFQRYLNRGERYRKLIKTVLNKHGLPSYFIYLALIESGFNIKARSTAKAVGLWQFIAPTAKRYGLRINGYVDERKDPVRATIAASQYLKDLYNVFNSWPLAMAAYNSGESRVMNSIMRAGTNDYWELVEKKALPRETSEYVPKFIAAAIIANQPQKFGFSISDDETPLPGMVSVLVPAPVRLTEVARVTKVQLASLQELNPHLLRGSTPPGVRKYRVWFPEHYEFQADHIHAMTPSTNITEADMFAEARPEPAPRQRSNNLRSSAAAASKANHYRVRRGDNLASVSRRFGVSISTLKRLNSIKRGRIYAGQVLRLDEQRG